MRLATYMTAEVGVCMVQNRCVRCGLAAVGAAEVLQACRRPFIPYDRTGGRYGWDQQTEIYIAHAYKGFNG